MNEAEFNQIVDELMFGVEETIDDSGVDIDYDAAREILNSLDIKQELKDIIFNNLK